MTAAIRNRLMVIAEETTLERQRCARCEAWTVVALFEDGQRMVVDVERTPDGLLVLYREALLGELVGPHRVRFAREADRRFFVGNLWEQHRCNGREVRT